MATILAGELVDFNLFLICHRNLGLVSDFIIAAASQKTSFHGINYMTTTERISGLLAPGSVGVNHGILHLMYFIHGLIANL